MCRHTRYIAGRRRMPYYAYMVGEQDSCLGIKGLFDQVAIGLRIFDQVAIGLRIFDQVAIGLLKKLRRPRLSLKSGVRVENPSIFFSDARSNDSVTFCVHVLIGSSDLS